MYPWQSTQWQQIMQRPSLPHALLLRGRAGIGKHAFALDLARSLLCSQQTNKLACGICASCIWFNEGGHPDFKLISPEDNDSDDEVGVVSKKKSGKKSQISVAQIRQLTDYLSLSNHQTNGRRVVLISPAELLNIASSNALLKMLEEPPSNTLFLLVSSQPQRLLATIISRCQALDMVLPNEADALAWLATQGVSHAKNNLEYAGGAPLLALHMAVEGDVTEKIINTLAHGAQLDPFKIAPTMLSLGMERAIDTLQKWVFDLCACTLTQTVHYNRTNTKALQMLSKSVNLNLLFGFQQKLIEAKKTANHPLSNEMQLENILMQYAQIFKIKR